MIVATPPLTSALAAVGSTLALPLQTGTVSYVDVLTRGALRIAGLGVFSFLVALVVTAVYRWYFRQPASAALGTFAGVSGVALYLNTKTAFASVVANQAAVFDPTVIVFNLSAFAVAVALGAPGARAGDRLAVETFAFLGTREVDGDIGQLVKAVGRVVTVEIPDEIDDVDGYDPVSEETKERMANKTLLFPRGLTVSDLEARVATRLREDYDVGYVDVDLDANGAVKYFAVGTRLAGIGPTLGPGMAAVAVRADPPNNAGPGDIVQVWRTEPSPERVATGELRGVADDVATLALDAADAERIAGGDYRLLTLPSDPGADRQFASVLRGADETMATVTVREGSALAEGTVGDVGATVAAVSPADGPIDPIPSRARPLAVGDVLYLVARPETLREAETAASPSAAGDGEGDA